MKLGLIQATADPKIPSKRMFVFAADHGIAAENVSAYPASVTPQMVLNFISGGAAISVLAHKYKIDLRVVDVGVNADFEKNVPIIRQKIRKGTRNFLQEDAMTEEELEKALAIGKKLVLKAQQDGADILGVGDMGIGNTTAASAITACLLQKPVEEVTGRGTGLDDQQLKHKIAVITQALQKRKIDVNQPKDILKKVGGYEIAAITGVALGCAENNLPLVVDGFIATVGVALAATLEPKVKEMIFPSHQSQEKGHGFLLEYLGLKPFLNLEMRLGEGTGAALAMDIFDTAVKLYKEMATFESAHVDNKT